MRAIGVLGYAGRSRPDVGHHGRGDRLRSWGWPVSDRAIDDDTFVMHVEASHAHRLESWFADAAIELRIEDSARCCPDSS
jgi:hypothetical protein